MLDAGREYSLQQTLDEHSSSITAVKFAGGGRAIETYSATYHQYHPYPALHCHLPPTSEKGVPVMESVGQLLGGLGLDGKASGM